MSYEQAQDKYIELMSYLMDNYEGYEPVYASYDEYKEIRRKTDEQNLNSLDRALTYFKDDNANIGRGTKRPRKFAPLKDFCINYNKITNQ